MKHQIRYIQTAVIRKGLVEGLLRQGYGLRFTLDEHDWSHEAVVHYSIAPLLGLTKRDSSLHGHEGSGISHFHHSVQQLLPYPFLWSQAHPTVAPFTEDLLLAVENPRPHLR